MVYANLDQGVDIGIGMIQFGALLIIGGVTGALWRQYSKSRISIMHKPALPKPGAVDVGADFVTQEDNDNSVFDDVGELSHYQKVAWYTFALSTAGSWFYPPVRLVCFPLLGYNAYHFARTVQNSDKDDRKSPLTVFQCIGVAGTLATGSIISGSLLLLFSFGTRKLLLNVGNIANNVGFSSGFNPRYARAWVLRDGVEIDILATDVLEEDIVILRAGENVVLEGEVLDGEAEVRQFSLGKKMKIIPKQKGDKVFPFTQLESGTLQMKRI